MGSHLWTAFSRHYQPKGLALPQLASLNQPYCPDKNRCSPSSAVSSLPYLQTQRLSFNSQGSGGRMRVFGWMTTVVLGEVAWQAIQYFVQRQYSIHRSPRLRKMSKVMQLLDKVGPATALCKGSFVFWLTTAVVNRSGWPHRR